MNAPQVPTSAAELAELFTLTVEIADEAARSSIECECVVHLDKGVLYRYVLMPDREIAEYIDRAVRYLALRGLIARHPEQPNLVRFVEASAA